jgi:uncharacterized Zn finger protein
VTGPLPPCPYRKKGQHRIAAILPGDDQHDVLLFCDACGMVSRQSVETPRPVDDWPDDAISRLSVRSIPK